MDTPSDKFVRGIVLAADAAFPEIRRSVLIGDAATLSNSGLLGQRPESMTPPGWAVAAVHVVSPWLSYRKSNPVRKLNNRFLGAVKAPQTICPDAWIGAHAVIDPDYSALLGGAQSVVRVLAPDISDVILKQDWTEFGNTLPNLVDWYRTQGIPSNGVPELLTLEYSRYRISSSNSVKQWVKNLITGKSGWYGYLDVHTIPELANVKVDGEEWGESPKARGVVPGSHKVAAKKGALRGTRDVEVPKVGSIRVDLPLA